MQYVTDLHLHSKFSNAVSKNMTLPVMTQFAAQKGIDILSATDFTHPLWFNDLQELLDEKYEGLYRLKSSEETNMSKEVLFLLSTEISSIYKQGDKVRRVHNLIFVPDIATVAKVNAELVRRGCNIRSDGRPIIGLSSRNLLELLLSIDERCFLIPCHIWTPHFGVLGSASGFNSLDEAFGDLAKYIYGIETGLSSDPEMNWQVRELMTRSILSFSDAHSAAKILREATVFDLEAPSFLNIKKAIMSMSATDSTSPTGNKIAYTLEFYPEEGKYHFSGHRKCNVILNPEQIREQGNICPVCKRILTEGVLYRVQELSDEKLLHRCKEVVDDKGIKWFTDSFEQQPPYLKLVPLLEIAAESLHSTVASQKSKNLYAKLCEDFGNELQVLLHTPIKDIEQNAGFRIAQGIQKVREGNIIIDPGYDGVYGKVEIWNEEEYPRKPKRKSN